MSSRQSSIHTRIADRVVLSLPVAALLLLASTGLGFGSVLAAPLTSSNTRNIPATILNVSQFDQIESGFDPVYGAVSLLWSIENPGQPSAETLHGALVLNASAVDPSFANSPVPNAYVAIGLGVCMLASEFIMIHAFPSGQGAEILNLISTQYYQAPEDNPGPTLFLGTTASTVNIISNSTSHLNSNFNSTSTSAVPSMVLYQGNGLVIGEFRRFTRPDPSDSYHKTINVSEVTHLIWSFNVNPASSPVQSFKISHGTNRGSYFITFASSAPGSAGIAESVFMPGRYTHGAVMGFTWTLLTPAAVYWARFGKSIPRFNKGWMWVHISTQVFAACVSIALIAYVITIIPPINFGPSFYFNILPKNHPVLGFTVLSLILLQLWLGPFNRLSLQLESLLHYRIYIREFHRWIGRSTLVLAWIQVGMGLNILFPIQNNPYDGRGGTVWWVLYFTFVGFWSIMFIGTEIFWSMKIRHRSAYVFVASELKGAPPTPKKKLTQASTHSEITLKPADQVKFGLAHPVKPLKQDSDFLTSTGASDPEAQRVMAPPIRIHVHNLPFKPAPPAKLFTWQDIDPINVKDSAIYVVAKGRHVFDIQQWIDSHPGGQIVLNQVAGTDVTTDFFEDAGYDAAAVIDKVTTPTTLVANRILPRLSHGHTTNDLLAPESIKDSSSTLSPNSAGSGSSKSKLLPPPRRQSITPTLTSLMEQQCRPDAPPLSEQDWRLLWKARRTNVHSQLAIEKLTSLKVGEIMGTQHLHLECDAPFNAWEYRRFAVLENTLVSAKSGLQSTLVYRLRLCVLFPHDIRDNEPRAFLPGQCVEIQLRTHGRTHVSRYFTPVSGTPACFEVHVKLNRLGALTPFLIRQKPGDRQIKVRGPFGTPLLDPRRLLSPKPSSTWAFEKLVFICGGSGLAAALQAFEWLFLPVYTPLLVVQSYEAAHDDELNLYEGDWVVTKSHTYDGWAYGINTRTGREGVFPLPVTSPRSGNVTQIHILNSMHTADDIFGSDLIRGALNAHGTYFSITHLFTRAIGSPEASREMMRVLTDMCPGEIEPVSFTSKRGRVTPEILSNSLNRVNWFENAAAMRKVVVCGPAEFESFVVDVLIHQIGVETRELLVLPPDTHL